mmetsp:Transcript_20780/g.65031  ORF Transcript_20780/g.65031 Transcript_20780/m.65031 type:complete len:497 (+) Transcript_20780:569-2059(+)
MPRLLAEVLAFSPDVALLQEVDRKWFETFWAPSMRQLGFSCVYTSKAGATSSEGLAAFVRTGALEMVEMREVSLAIGPSGAPAAAAPLLDSHAGTREGVRRLPTVAQLLLLREAAPGGSGGDGSSGSGERRHALVANTHLYFSNPAMHVRLLQTAALLEEMDSWAEHLPAATPRIVAGDLNADASDAAIKLLTTGRVEAGDPDWLHGALNWAPSLELEEAAGVAARQAAATLGAGWDAVGDAEVEAAWARLADGSDDGVGVAAGADGAACPDATFEGARRVAREHHLLRVAATTLARSPDERTDEQAAGGRGAVTRLAASILDDAARGRSLYTSRPLAAAEVARQLQLPLAAVSTPANDVQATSWYTRAHTRLGELMQRLLKAKVELRSRAASEGSAAALAAGEAAEVRLWAARAAGVCLSHPKPLQSVYSLDSPPTHVVPRYATSIDWICVDAERLEVVGVAPRPPLQELTRDVAMPSAEWPSDHISLVADLAWR